MLVKSEQLAVSGCLNWHKDNNREKWLEAEEKKGFLLDMTTLPKSTVVSSTKVLELLAGNSATIKLSLRACWAAHSFSNSEISRAFSAAYIGRDKIERCFSRKHFCGLH
jgi:hypothetical protein